VLILSFMSDQLDMFGSGSIDPVLPERKFGIQRLREWSLAKHEIIFKYCPAYNKIVKKYWATVYADAFAGSNRFYDEKTFEVLPGSPERALRSEPTFDEFHFIDLKKERAARLREMYEDRNDVKVYEGDCNRVIQGELLPSMKGRKGLFVLDPYGIHYHWKTVALCGQAKDVELFLNYPVMDILRNGIRKKANALPESLKNRMDLFWGDSDWEKLAYETVDTILADPITVRKIDPEQNVIRAYIERLRTVAGFAYVSKPVIMRFGSSKLYYLIHAAQKPVASKIMKDIMSKYEVLNIS
jgi:three-Cys-motif partner protein